MSVGKVFTFYIDDNINIKILLLPVRYERDKKRYVQITVNNKTETTFEGVFPVSTLNDFRKMLWQISNSRHKVVTVLKRGGGIKAILSDRTLTVNQKRKKLLELINENIKN